MTITQLINELQSYPSNTEVYLKLVKNEHDESQDKRITWIGEIDTSLLDSDEPSLDIGLSL